MRNSGMDEDVSFPQSSRHGKYHDRSGGPNAPSVTPAIPVISEETQMMHIREMEKAN